MHFVQNIKIKLIDSRLSIAFRFFLNVPPLDEDIFV